MQKHLRNQSTHRYWFKSNSMWTFLMHMSYVTLDTNAVKLRIVPLVKLCSLKAQTEGALHQIGGFSVNYQT